MEKRLSAVQVADHLGMHPKTLYRLLRENKIALNFERIHGRAIAFKPSEVERFLSLREIRRDGSGAKKKAANSLKRSPKETSTKTANEVVGYTAAVYLTDEEAKKFFKGLKAPLRSLLGTSQAPRG
jgi:predicted DNA-binding transcriptional regulator AlpA